MILINKIFDADKQKIRKMWESVNSNRISIEIDKNTNNILLDNISLTSAKNFRSERFLDLSTDWSDFEVFTFDEENNWTEEVYKSWEVSISGLNFAEAGNVKINHIFKFGTGEELLGYNLQDTTDIYTINYIEPTDLTNTETNLFTYHYGIYLSSPEYGLSEIDSYGMKVKLQIEVFNPHFYR